MFGSLLQRVLDQTVVREGWVGVKTFERLLGRATICAAMGTSQSVHGQATCDHGFSATKDGAQASRMVQLIWGR